MEAIAKNAADFGIEYLSGDERQGIVHCRAEQGFTLPGMTIVCGDSHTSTHGAFGALALTSASEVEHVSPQTLIQRKAKNMLVQVDDPLPEGVTARTSFCHHWRDRDAGGTGM